MTVSRFMPRKPSRMRDLLQAPDRFARLRLLGEIRLNHLLFPEKPSGEEILPYVTFLQMCEERYPELHELMQPDGEAAQAVRHVVTRFQEVLQQNTMQHQELPFPTTFNADHSLAMLCYALTRFVRPDTVLETGVGYGISSAVTLLALERNGKGRLMSVDLAPLSDRQGAFVGIAVPDAVRHRWTLHRGDSRQWLGRLLQEAGGVGLFLSDSANVYSLQKHEWKNVWPYLAPGGAALFNNISSRFWDLLRTHDGAAPYAIRQVDKTQCTTGLVLKGAVPASA